MENLHSIGDSICTGSTKQRILIFRHEIPAILSSSEMSSEIALALVDIIFKTLFIYDDKGSRNAVDGLIVTALSEVIFMKSFAAALVECMEKQSKLQSHTGCYILLKWSCLLLSKSQYASLSKNALCRVASVQASVLHIVMQASFHERRACKRKIIHLLSESADIYRSYMEELKEARIPYKDAPEFIQIVLEFSISNPSVYDQWKMVFLDMYVKAVLNCKEKPGTDLIEAFCPLFSYLMHEDFKSIVVPSSVKVLKRNPELVLESVGILLKSTNLDLSKYAVEILSVVSPQTRHADELRRLAALDIVRCLVQKSSNPDAVELMFHAIKSVVGGSEGRLAFPYQRVGMINAIEELSNSPEGTYLTSLSPTICTFLLSCYKEDGNEEVKLASLSALGSWAARSADAVQPDLISIVTSGLEEKEAIRRGHLRCLRVMSKKADTIVKMSSLVLPLVQLVKTGYTKAVQRLDGIYALLILAKISAVDSKADEIVSKEKVWSLISQNEHSLVPISLVSKLPVEDCMACVDLVEVLLVDHSHRVLEVVPAKSISQLILFFMCHQSWETRRVAYDVTKRVLAAVPELSEPLLIQFSNYLSAVAEKHSILKTSDTENALDAHTPYVSSAEVLVKALFAISSTALFVAPNSCILIILCAHHPCLLGSGKQDSVWMRLLKCLQKQEFDIIGLIMSELPNFCKALLGPIGFLNTLKFEKKAAVNSLWTLLFLCLGHTNGGHDESFSINLGTAIIGIEFDNKLATSSEGRSTRVSDEEIVRESNQKIFQCMDKGVLGFSGTVDRSYPILTQVIDALTKDDKLCISGVVKVLESKKKQTTVAQEVHIKRFGEYLVSFFGYDKANKPYMEGLKIPTLRTVMKGMFQRHYINGKPLFCHVAGSGASYMLDFVKDNIARHKTDKQYPVDAILYSKLAVCYASLSHGTCGGYVRTAIIEPGKKIIHSEPRHVLTEIAPNLSFYKDSFDRSFFLEQTNLELSDTNQKTGKERDTVYTAASRDPLNYMCPNSLSCRVFPKCFSDAAARCELKCILPEEFNFVEYGRLLDEEVSSTFMSDLCHNLKIGQKCTALTKNGEFSATIRFWGPVSELEVGYWVGVEFDYARLGDHDGSIPINEKEKKRYFNCEHKRDRTDEELECGGSASFLRPDKIKVAP